MYQMVAALGKQNHLKCPSKKRQIIRHRFSTVFIFSHKHTKPKRSSIVECLEKFVIVELRRNILLLRRFPRFSKHWKITGTLDHLQARAFGPASKGWKLFPPRTICPDRAGFPVGRKTHLASHIESLSSQQGQQSMSPMILRLHDVYHMGQNNQRVVDPSVFHRVETFFNFYGVFG